MNGFTNETTPPPALKQRVLQTLRDRGLIRRPARGWRVTGLAAAVAAIFAAGVLVGHRAEALGGHAAAAGPRWVLFLYEGPEYQPTNAEAERVAEYGAWAAKLHAKHVLELGEKLAPGQRLLGPAPADEAGGAAHAVAGLFIIAAPDSARAVAIASTCPHLRYGGWISVRRIEET